jgi:hypothetical protein
MKTVVRPQPCAQLEAMDELLLAGFDMRPAGGRRTRLFANECAHTAKRLPVSWTDTQEFK